MIDHCRFNTDYTFKRPKFDVFHETGSGPATEGRLPARCLP
jgi:hypothetical protein